MDGTKETYFASPQEADAEQLRSQIASAAGHPLATTILDSFGGIVLILNEQRQAVAVNANMMKRLGFEDPNSLLGVRMGTALGCSHEPEAPNGCGTGKACSSCGGAIAILASQKTKKTVERECLIDRTKDGQPSGMEFRIRAAPLEHKGDHFTVLTLQDIRAEKRWETLQAVYFHDVMNIMTSLCGSIDLSLAVKDPVSSRGYLQEAQRITLQMIHETRAHQEMCTLASLNYPVDIRSVAVKTVLRGVRDVFSSGAVVEGKTLSFQGNSGDLRLMTDRLLVQRVLVNMVKNALEATDAGGEARFSTLSAPEYIRFEVWNDKPIPERVVPRIFQRYFTTKDGAGRGLGTFSMKLFGEEVLGGKVSFTSSAEAGTVFAFELPRTLGGQSQDSDS